MLFRKKIQKSCAYCAHSTELDDTHILCSKKGIREKDGKCFRFRYNPIKRIPLKAKPLDFSKYSQEDFTL